MALHFHSNDAAVHPGGIAPRRYSPAFRAVALLWFACQVDPVRADAAAAKRAGPVSIADFDYNNSGGRIGFDDFLLFAGAFGHRVTEDETYRKYDHDGDGAIGFGDFLLFADHYGKEVPVPITPPAVAGLTDSLSEDAVYQLPLSELRERVITDPGSEPVETIDFSITAQDSNAVAAFVAGSTARPPSSCLKRQDQQCSSTMSTATGSSLTATQASSARSNTGDRAGPSHTPGMRSCSSGHTRKSPAPS